MSDIKTPSVVILGFDGALASAITGVADLFSLSGVSWQRFNNKSSQSLFDVKICSYQQRNIKCINKTTLHAHAAIETIEHCDLLLIPTIGGDVDRVLAENRMLIPHIIRLNAAGAELASNCSGAFLLAEAGLLDGKEATTHWGYADKFAHQYPAINLQTNKLITQSDGVFCAGGGMAWYDLALLLIERYHSRESAQETAKSHLIDMQRGNQAVYANLRQHRQHHDVSVLKAQQYIEESFDKPLTVNKVADVINISNRTLIRRFKASVDMTPIAYIQRVKLEQAKRLFESGNYNVSQVAQRIAYEDVSSFSRLFKRETGLSPFQYKNKFSKV